MHFRSYQDLIVSLHQWQQDLPRDFTVICGLPRSGLLVANLLALQWNLPLTDPDNLAAGRLLAAGERLGRLCPQQFFGRRQKILVIDDSVHGGGTLRKARAMLASLATQHELHFAAVYASPEGLAHVEFAAETLPLPRVFEWNLFHHPILTEACMDIDGVLCPDPAADENDDGLRYREFLSGSRPRHIPSVKVRWLVTSRLEKYRRETEAWLERHRVCYEQLLMLDLPDQTTRIATKGGPVFKAQQYRRSGARLFIESDPKQASFIAEQAQNYVICTDTMQIFGPGLVAKTILHTRRQLFHTVPSQLMVWRNRVRRAIKLLGGTSRPGYARATASELRTPFPPSSGS
jgi:orotate phosphoribosyltransferase